MRILILGLLVAGLIGSLGTHQSLAKNTEKVNICHVNSANSAGVLEYEHEYRRWGRRSWWGSYNYIVNRTITETYNLGRVISIDASDLARHLAHGDASVFSELTEDVEAYITGLEDIEDSYTSFFHRYGGYWYWYYYSAGWDRKTYDSDLTTNAVVKNANCYFKTTKIVTN